MSSSASHLLLFKRNDSFNTGWSNCMSNALCRSISWTAIAFSVVLILLLIANILTKRLRKSSSTSRQPLRRSKTTKNSNLNNTEFIPLATGPEYTSRNAYSHNITKYGNDDLFSMMDPKAYSRNTVIDDHDDPHMVRASMSNIPIIENTSSSFDDSGINDSIGHISHTGNPVNKNGYQMV